jgi:hypothetical protein
MLTQLSMTSQTASASSRTWPAQCARGPRKAGTRRFASMKRAATGHKIKRIYDAHLDKLFDRLFGKSSAERNQLRTIRIGYG